MMNAKDTRSARLELASSKREERSKLLITMYGQMFGNINRHILVVWQGVGVVVGAFAAIAFSDKLLFALDYAVALELALIAWFLAHVIDSNNWCLRNLDIISNIESQLLAPSDRLDIHPFIGQHRTAAITHLSIQSGLGLATGALVLVFHFQQRVYPGLTSSFNQFDLPRALPYVVAALGLPLVRALQAEKMAKRAAFRATSSKRLDSSAVQSPSGSWTLRIARKVQETLLGL